MKIMRYEYGSLYYIVGMHVPSCEQIYDCGPIKAVLTTQPDAYCQNLDRHRAARSLIGTDGTGTDDERLERELQELRRHRTRRFAGGAFLSIQGAGECSIDEKYICERGSFSLAIDAIRPGELQQRYEQLIFKLLAAIAIAIPGVMHFKKISEASVFFDDMGRPVFSFTIQGQRPTVVVSATITKEDISRVRELVDKLSPDKRMDQVLRLLDRSLDEDEDQAHRFRFAWNSIEAFLKAYSREYKKEFRDNLPSGGAPNKVRKAGRGLGLEKLFIMMVSVLNPTGADTDIDKFRRAEKLRNNFFHGDRVDECALPVEEIQGLVRKLIQLHIGRATWRAS